MSNLCSLIFSLDMQKLLVLLLIMAQQPVFSQKINKYWVEFHDKNNSPYCTCRPAEFLSARALERRAKAGIEVLENDLPVNPAYLQQLGNAGAQIHNTSRWLNAAAVMADSSTAERLKTISSVRAVRYLGPHLKYRNPPNRPVKTRKPLSEAPSIPGDGIPHWGYATQQNQLLGIPLLHQIGHRGAGIWIAVMDGGFTNADTIPMFDSVAVQGRLYPGWDFVERDAGIFEAAQHGTAVLSVMAANLPQYFVGTAPEATYFLLKTEDTGGEFPIEEANWVAGAEWADSLGIDIINASLGYTSYNDPSLSHTYAVLDGRTAIASRGAVVAVSKGMIVCNSAGNEGDGTWRYIGVPADAPGLVAVGAVDESGKRASFSSFGPTPDGRIKPDLVAPGDEVVVAGNVGIALGLSSGTSLASPMLAGALAALWSAFPEKTAQEILDAAFLSADQQLRPDNARGYGLPEMTEAWIQLGQKTDGNGGIFSFDPWGNYLELAFPGQFFQTDDALELRNLLGQKMTDVAISVHPNIISTLQLRGLDKLPAGHYQIVMIHKTGVKRIGVALWR